MPVLKIRFMPTKKRVVLKVVDKDEVLASFKLKATKTLDGNIIIQDHHDIDVVVRPEMKTIVTYKKEGADGATTYGASDRMFKYLSSRGIISLDSVQGGPILDSYEAKIPESNLKAPIKVALLSISKWIESERPYFEYGEEYDEMMDDRLLNPDDEESTELGEVPQDKQKGSIVPGYYRSPYWMSYILEQAE